ncbi:hypothetical protein NMY3_02747 [Candidatus Nitrosocosmicus oleophilus]|jgi:hypothetical protein|uniref:Uncharacterized protein n=1 Tax=Candidatus Nitrosocosmicus oleophilus TaxID=1353260 RepID=A0A654M192_9ARCH|nr:hypothetical protein NMY3_02747 [Candidatus Nitrosocosmicus oleophilus]
MLIDGLYREIDIYAMPGFSGIVNYRFCLIISWREPHRKTTWQNMTSKFGFI